MVEGWLRCRAEDYSGVVMLFLDIIDGDAELKQDVGRACRCGAVHINFGHLTEHDMQCVS